MVFVITAWFGNPLPVFGFDQSPEQPIAFPHTVHADTEPILDEAGNPKLAADGTPLTGIGLDCTFCHRTVTTSNAAGIPPVETCVTCHRVIGSTQSEPLTILRTIGLGDDAGPIQWKRVHRLPDTVRFVHEPHIRFLTASGNTDVIANRDESAILAATNPDGSVMPSVTCSTCHGDVKTQVQVAQVEPLKMGQCVDCHRKNDAPTGCTTCHF
ncbi:MAG: cytochrome c3 family protein [Chloroflexi bacterium]|nr:cytochrome c3 family protein [Chloroflexota bacterium]